MGASAVATGLHDQASPEFTQLTLPRGRISYEGRTRISSSSSADKGDVCLVSRSPSTPGLVGFRNLPVPISITDPPNTASDSWSPSGTTTRSIAHEAQPFIPDGNRNLQSD